MIFFINIEALKIGRQKRDLTLQQVAKEPASVLVLFPKLKFKNYAHPTRILKIMQTLSIDLSELDLSSNVSGRFTIVIKLAGELRKYGKIP